MTIGTTTFVAVMDSTSTRCGYLWKASKAVTVHWSHPESVCELSVVLELELRKMPVAEKISNWPLVIVDHEAGAPAAIDCAVTIGSTDSTEKGRRCSLRNDILSFYTPLHLRRSTSGG